MQVSKGFYKSASFIVNAAAVTVGVLPDAINVAIDNAAPMIDVLLPTLSPQSKVLVLGAANVLAMLLRAWKQRSVEKAAIQQAAEEGKVVPLPASGVAPLE